MVRLNRNAHFSFVQLILYDNRFTVDTLSEPRYSGQHNAKAYIPSYTYSMYVYAYAFQNHRQSNKIESETNKFKWSGPRSTQMLLTMRTKCNCNLMHDQAIIVRCFIEIIFGESRGVERFGLFFLYSLNHRRSCRQTQMWNFFTLNFKLFFVFLIFIVLFYVLNLVVNLIYRKFLIFFFSYYLFRFVWIFYQSLKELSFWKQQHIFLTSNLRLVHAVFV